MRTAIPAELAAIVEAVTGTRPPLHRIARDGATPLDLAAELAIEEAEARLAEAEDAGPPEGWPAWTDDARAALGPRRRPARGARR